LFFLLKKELLNARANISKVAENDLKEMMERLECPISQNEFKDSPENS
jgi:hypothetical protein